MKQILIRWAGPISLSELVSVTNPEFDYGVYQIYGSHPVYGPERLLYIGKAAEQTFGERVAQERWEDSEDSAKITVYVGRLIGDDIPHDDEWTKLINVAERLLIYAHAPAYNSQCISTAPPSDLEPYHVLNFGSYRAIAPEVSGARWTRPSSWERAKQLFRYKTV